MANFISPKRDLIENLDELPFPAYDLFPLEEVYFKNSALMYSEEGMMATREIGYKREYRMFFNL